MNPEALSALARLSAWVIQTTVAATILAVLVALVQLLWRRRLPAGWSYALWLLVVARLLWPVAPASSFSLFNLGVREDTDLFTTQPPADSPGSAFSTAVPLALPAGHTSLPGLDQPAAGGQASAPIPRQRTAPPAFQMIFPWVWLAGFAGYLVLVKLQHRKVAAWVRRQTPLSDHRLTDLVEETRLAIGARRQFALLEAPQVSAPALFGWRRPVLLLPPRLLQSLAPAELRQVFLHEMAHLKHGDVLVNYVLILARALHWFNPIVWLALRRVRAERELYCDAVVLSKLTSAERHAYGNTLLKVCAAITRPVLNPNFVPILSRKPQIHRRITMTTQFQPASRIAVLAALCVTLALGGLTFTGAAEKEPLPSTASPPSASASAPQKTPATREAVSTEILMKRLSEQEESIRKTRSKMDDLRNILQITGDEGTVASLIDNQNFLRRLESNRIEAEAEYKRFFILYTNLTHLSRVDLRRAVSTAVPDQLLNNLLDRYHTAEQKVAELSEKFGPEHPDVKQAARVLKLIDKQIEDRLDGILTGLKAKCEAERASTSELGKQIDNAKKRQVQEAIERRPYEETKRELQRKEQLRDRLELLLLEKELGALPSNPE